MEPKAKKPWTKKYRDLKPKFRRMINNFMSSRPDYLKETDHAYNWKRDCMSYQAPEWLQDYYAVTKMYDERGRIPELPNPVPGTVGTASHHPDCICNACRGPVRPPE